MNRAPIAVPEYGPQKSGLAAKYANAATSYGPIPVEGTGATALSSPILLPLGTLAYSVDAATDFFTEFDLDVPEVLPNLAPFTTPGFPGAGEFVDGFIYITDGASLFTLDPTGAVVDTIAITLPPGTHSYTGMALDPTDGTVYLTSCDITTSNLYTLDVETGIATLVGVITNSPCTIGIAVDGNGDLYSHDIVIDSILWIDKTSGAGTVLGLTGFDANYGQGMGWDKATDTLYLAAFNGVAFQPELRIVDRTTGNTTLVGVLGQTTPGVLVQLPFLAVPNETGCEGDIPWASVSPITGTLLGGTSTPVEVTFDSTGLANGVYTATLCVFSNDPDEKLTEVPLNMTVADPTYLAVGHLAPFAADPGTAVTITLNGAPALTNFAYGDSTGYITLPEDTYDVAVWPAGSTSPAITATVTLLPDTYYTAVAIGDGVNQPLSLLALVDDLTPPAVGYFHLRLGHLAPFASGDALADIRLQDGTPILTNVAFGDVTAFIPLAAGVYDLKITTPGGAVTLIDPVPVTFSEGDIVTAFATGDGSNQWLGVFAWPADDPGFFLRLIGKFYLPLVMR